jgi:flagellar basal-body rod protein FlgF
MDAPDALTSSANGMRAQAAELDVIARNLANASTSGYRVRAQALSGDGSSFDSCLQFDRSQGALRKTDVPTDLALVGPGYFALATPDGVRYTRDGSFTVDPKGLLRDQQGNPVLGSLGPARFPQGAKISEDGRIKLGDRVIDRLRIVSFDRPCVDQGSNLLAAPDSTLPRRSFASVRCGYLEDSGVDAIGEMTALVRAQRSFEANQKCLEQTDESLRKLIIEAQSSHT